MNARFDEKGKIFTQRVSKDVVVAVIRTVDYFIIGDVHVRPDRRLKDELDNTQSRFLPVTEAIVYDATGTQLLYRTNFMLLAYDQVIMVAPLDAFTEFGNAPWQHMLAQEPAA
jgi:hypothetical protein